MVHLIDKDALVAEIEKLYDEAPTWDDSRHYVGKVLDIIDTLEVKDLQEEPYVMSDKGKFTTTTK